MDITFESFVGYSPECVAVEAIVEDNVAEILSVKIIGNNLNISGALTAAVLQELEQEAIDAANAQAEAESREYAG